MAQVIKNRLVRAALIEHDIPQYELADAIGISESGVSRLLRAELTEKNQQILADFIKKMRTDKPTKEDRFKAKLAITSAKCPCEKDLLYETFGTSSYLRAIVDMKHEITALQDQVRYLEAAVRRHDYSEEY